MKSFGMAKNKETHLYELTGSTGLTATVTDYGATLVSLVVKGIDVVTGYDSVEGYMNNTCFFGATVGRNANRIANARCVIDGKEYQLEVNDNENNLHSGANHLGSRVWDVKAQGDNFITFSILDEDMSDDFPGNLQMEVTYTLTDENALEIKYHGVCDADTVCNFTNHTYFNLNGHDTGLVTGHKFLLNANEFTPVIDGKAIPTGELQSVEGTPFDFRVEKTIGQDIEKDDDQLRYGTGYDHNFAIDFSKDFVARLTGDQSGIVMEVVTDLPGIQLYTGNFIEGQIGKGGVKHVKRGALCLETQYFPNAVNESRFESPILKANEAYDTVTTYRFK